MAGWKGEGAGSRVMTLEHMKSVLIAVGAIAGLVTVGAALIGTDSALIWVHDHVSSPIFTGVAAAMLIGGTGIFVITTRRQSSSDSIHIWVMMA